MVSIAFTGALFLFFLQTLVLILLQAVPKNFANNIKGQIPECVKLEVPDGKSYDIQISKEHNELVFQSGWAKFASAYELEQCDMLVFRYSRGSDFRVQIFDQSGCEKEFSCAVVNRTPSVKERLVKMLQL
jgi:hypothetical protein